MPIVVDACVTAAWIFEDERNAYAMATARHVERHGAFAPLLWRWEIQNTLLAALRRKRIRERELTEYVIDLQALPIQLDIATDFGVELMLAKEHGLSVYDAGYLELAMRLNCRLATTDSELARAARSLGVFFDANEPATPR